jgi:ATP-dependent Clp protease ATP-binding subunit ClpA
MSLRLNQCFPDCFLPDKAIDLVDKACAKLKDEELIEQVFVFCIIQLKI